MKCVECRVKSVYTVDCGGFVDRIGFHLNIELFHFISWKGERGNGRSFIVLHVDMILDIMILYTNSLLFVCVCLPYELRVLVCGCSLWHFHFHFPLTFSVLRFPFSVFRINLQVII